MYVIMQIIFATSKPFKTRHIILGIQIENKILLNLPSNNFMIVTMYMNS